MRRLIASICIGSCGAAFASEPLQSTITPFGYEDAEQIVLQNDSFNEAGGQAYIQLGFVKGEKAGIWVEVPQNVKQFKIDSFRVLIGNADDALMSSEDNTQVFFEMGVRSQLSPAIPRDIENAAQITAGPYWNDIPAQGADSELPCARAGEFVGAALEFTHAGAPSVYRDLDNVNPTRNSIFAIPGGWRPSVTFGVRGDWILRVVGHEAEPGECN